MITTIPDTLHHSGYNLDIWYESFRHDKMVKNHWSVTGCQECYYCYYDWQQVWQVSWDGFSHQTWAAVLSWDLDTVVSILVITGHLWSPPQHSSRSSSAAASTFSSTRPYQHWTAVPEIFIQWILRICSDFFWKRHLCWYQSNLSVSPSSFSF